MLVMVRAGYQFGDYVSPQNYIWTLKDYNDFEIHPTVTIEFEYPIRD